MSNVGQGIAGVVGAVIGFYAGGPTGAAYGFQAGLALGSIISPTKLDPATGPQISDTRTTQAQVGGPVPIVYGQDAVAGTVIYLGPLDPQETTSTEGGKGAPTQDVTTFTYRQTIAIGLCRGPIFSVTRIWENGKLVYDVRPQRLDEPDADYDLRVTATAQYAVNLQVYLGTEDQEPDPTIEMEKGVGTVPAFRGLAYIVIANRELRSDQALRHPNFKFEINNSGSFISRIIYLADEQWVKPAGLIKIDVERCQAGGGGGGGGAVGATGEIRRGGGGGGGGGLSQTLNIAAEDLPDTVQVTVGHGGQGGPPTTTSGARKDGSPGFNGGDSSFGSFCSAQGGGRGGGGTTPGGGGTGTSAGGLGGSGTLEDGGDGGVSATGSNAVAGGNTAHAGAGGGGGGSRDAGNTGEPASGGNGNTAVPGEVNPGGAGAGVAVGTSGLPGDSSPPTDPGGGGGGGGGSWSGGSNWFGGAGGNGGYFGAGGAGGGAANNFTDPIGIGGPGGNGQQGVVVVRQYFEFNGSTQSLADIVSDVCAQCGLTSDMIDVSDLEDDYIRGYQLTRVMNGRAAITPLCSVGFFDCVDTGSQLVFRKRGKAAVATLSEADLGMCFDGETEVPPALTPLKTKDEDLPRVIRVHYKSEARDYDLDEAVSPVRINTRAVNEVDIQLPVCISGDRAAQVVEILYVDAWESRWTYSTQLAREWLGLDPTNCIIVPDADRTRRLRLVSVVDEPRGGLRRVQLARDFAANYTSEAVAGEVMRLPTQVSMVRGTALILLDIPALTEADDDPGIYAVAVPTGAGSAWTGAALFRSIDNGTSFTPSISITHAPPVGELVGAAPAADAAYTFDEDTVLTVDLDAADAELESRTETAVLNGANCAAIGAHGRWEIVQFRTAQQISSTPNRWELSGILRGRRGTEHFVGTSEAGDRFVMLSMGGRARLSMQTSEIGALRVYKAVSIGAQYSTGTDHSLIGAGVALEPFSPTNIAGDRDGLDDLTISWLRRDRLAQTLRSGVPLAMSEATEAYEIEILSGETDRVVLRTLQATDESVIYTAAQQTADFGGPQLEVLVRVYQLSAAVGRGTPAEAFV